LRIIVLLRPLRFRGTQLAICQSNRPITEILPRFTFLFSSSVISLRLFVRWFKLCSGVDARLCLSNFRDDDGSVFCMINHPSIFKNFHAPCYRCVRRLCFRRLLIISLQHFSTVNLAPGHPSKDNICFSSHKLCINDKDRRTVCVILALAGR
jgi:hypothetical protein